MIFGVTIENFQIKNLFNIFHGLRIITNLWAIYYRPYNMDHMVRSIYLDLMGWSEIGRLSRHR